MYGDKDKYEPAHDKTYNKTFATSENSDHANRMCILQPPGYPKRLERELFSILIGCTR